MIPVVFHNLRGYDSHHIMEKLGTYKNKQVTVIPNTPGKIHLVFVGQSTLHRLAAIHGDFAGKAREESSTRREAEVQEYE